MARVPKNSSDPGKGDRLPEVSRPARRERRAAAKPSAADIAAEAASIYPDTFETPPSPAEIAAEAYAIYQARGGEHGRHEDDWFEAERRVLERKRRT